MSNVTILVNSCDLYEDAWEPFFRLLSIQWPNCPYDIVLNTENKKFDCDYLNVRTVCTHEQMWTCRVQEALEAVNTEYVLFCLEDFFFLDKVDEVRFRQIIQSMSEDKMIGFVKLLPIKHNKTVFQGKRYNEFFIEEPKMNPWRCNAVMAIWRKDFLREMLFLRCDPWEFEFGASQLSLFSKKKCLYIPPDSNRMISYSFQVQNGIGITRKKWLKGNVELFQTYGIKVNFERLGFLEETEPAPISIIQPDEEERTIEEKSPLLRKTRKVIRRVRKKWSRSAQNKKVRAFLKPHLKFILWFLPRYGKYRKHRKEIYMGEKN